MFDINCRNNDIKTIIDRMTFQCKDPPKTNSANNYFNVIISSIFIKYSIQKYCLPIVPTNKSDLYTVQLPTCLNCDQFLDLNSFIVL